MILELKKDLVVCFFVLTFRSGNGKTKTGLIDSGDHLHKTPMIEGQASYSYTVMTPHPRSRTIDLVVRVSSG